MGLDTIETATINKVVEGTLVKKRALAGLVALVLLVSSVNLSAWAAGMESQGSELPLSEEELFVHYPKYLDFNQGNLGVPRELFFRSNEITTDAASGFSAWLASFMSVCDFKEALGVIFSESIEPGGEDLQEKWRNSAAEALYLAVAQTDPYVVMSEEFNEVYEKAKTVEEAIGDLSVLCTYLSESELASVFEDAMNYADFVFDQADFWIDYVQYGMVIVTLYHSERVILDTLIMKLERGGSGTQGELVQGLYRLREYMSANPAGYIFDRFMQDKIVADAIADVMVRGAETAFPLVKIVNIALKLTSAYYFDILELPLAEDITKAVSLGSFCEELGSAMSCLQIDILQAAINGTAADKAEENISAYRILYETYFVALCQYAEAAHKLDKDAASGYLDNYLSLFRENCTYDQFLERNIALADRNEDPIEGDSATTNPELKAEKAVKTRLDELCALLEGKYFTTTGVSCGNSKCESCIFENVIASDVFAEAVGGFVPDMTVERNFTAEFTHYYGDDKANDWQRQGASCTGFANFAGWYLFARTATDRVVFEPMGPLMSSSEDSFKALDVRPGDLLRMGDAVNASKHSAVFIEATDEGIKVLDCNWGLAGDGHGCIRVHTIPYSKYSYVCASRATNRTIYRPPVVSGVCGAEGAMVWTLDKSTGVLTISSPSKVDDWRFSDDPWVAYYDQIGSVIVDKGVKSICFPGDKPWYLEKMCKSGI